MPGRPVVLALLVLLATGCVSPAGDVVPAAEDGEGLFGAVTGERLPPPTEDLSGAIVSDHGAPYLHAVPDLHHGSYGMELVGYNPMTREDGEGDHPLAQNSAYNAITLFGHLACVAHWAGSGGYGGATIVNFSDPADPVVVASIPSLGLSSRCQFTEDGRFLLFADYGGVLPGTPLPEPLHNPLSFGVTVYDVSDPASPRFLFHDSQGASVGDPEQVAWGAYHNVGTARINGTNYVFQTYSGNILALAEDGTSMEIVATVEHSEHDMWVGPPVTGEWMYVTGAGKGAAFYNVDDPAKPVLLGVWAGNGTYDGWHRQWPLLQTVGGRALMVVAGEACTTGKSLPYTVLDFTDPANVVELGHWHIPGKPEIKEPGQLCSMNSHEFNTWNGYVATGNYHAGVWLFDVGTPERALEPVTIGYHLPNEDPRAHGGTRNTPFAWNPDVWGAYFDDRGYVVAADWSTGFYVLRFGATAG